MGRINICDSFEEIPDSLVDTIWYNLWAVENAKYEQSTINQKGSFSELSSSSHTVLIILKEFFIQNFDAWKDHYAEATRIFRRAVQGEIDLWATAEDPGDV